MILAQGMAERPLLRAARREILRVARFGLVGVGATVCYAIVTFAIVWSGLGGSIVATIIGQGTSAFISYFGHLHFSFRVEPDHRAFLWRFVVVAVATFALNLLLTWGLISIFHEAYQVPIVAVAIALPIASYLLNRFWIFVPRLRGSSRH